MAAKHTQQPEGLPAATVVTEAFFRDTSGVLQTSHLAQQLGRFALVGAAYDGVPRLGGVPVLTEPAWHRALDTWVHITPFFASSNSGTQAAATANLPLRYDLGFASAADKERFLRVLAEANEAALAADLAAEHARRRRDTFGTHTYIGGHGWHRSASYAPRPRATMLGAVAPAVIAEMDALAATLLKPENVAHLIAVGENNSFSVNFLFRGPPGTGKTSTIQAWASEAADGSARGFPLYVVGSNALSCMGTDEMSVILNPTTETAGGVAVVVLEDADRWFASIKGGKPLSSFLNALDGIAAKRTTIVFRVFTCNDPRVMLDVDAVASRIPRHNCFAFPPPSAEDLEAKLRKFFSGPFLGPQEDAVARLMPLLRSAPTLPSMRAFSHYVMRFMFYPNAVDLLVEHAADLLPTPSALAVAATAAGKAVRGLFKDAASPLPAPPATVERQETLGSQGEGAASDTGKREMAATLGVAAASALRSVWRRQQQN